LATGIDDASVVTVPHFQEDAQSRLVSTHSAELAMMASVQLGHKLSLVVPARDAEQLCA
jgi:hypothetical protein